MKKLLSFASVICLFSSYIFAQSFEGTIEFQKQTATDTVNYVYYVKGDKIRIDEVGVKSKKIAGSFIVDLTTKSMTMIDRDRKLYVEQGTGAPGTVTGKPEVKSTGKTKTIQGVKCSEYVVKNPDEKVQVTYWLSFGHYDFFQKLLKILNRKDKSALYFQQLVGVEGMFPFLSSQVNIETGKEEIKMEVTKVQKKNIEASMFEIPKDYQKFQK